MTSTTPDAPTVEAAPMTGEAERLRGLFQRTAERELAAMAIAARLILRSWAEAEIAIQAARHSDEPGASNLPSAEAFRIRPYLPREEVSRKRIVRWLGADRQPLDDETDRQAVKLGSSWVVMHPGTDVPRMYLGERAEFERVTYQEAQERLDLPKLFESLAVPAVVAGSAIGWEPHKDLDPASVLAHLDAIEASNVTHSAERVITIECILLHRVAPPQIDAAVSIG